MPCTAILPARLRPWCAVLALAALGAAPAAAAEPGGTAPPAWTVAPFVALLAAIAVLPLAASRFWHHWYHLVAVGLAGATALATWTTHGDCWPLLHVAFEYGTFISLLGCLYLCAGGIVVRVNRRGTPAANLGLLLGGALFANLVGTTGASLLLIRPFLAMNQGRLRPYHLAFFIFMVANVGGCLTPIGDPPLLLGFLRGIGFFHFAVLAWAPWLLAIAMLGAVFWAIDRRAPPPEAPPAMAQLPVLTVLGWRNLGLLLLAVGAIFLDPAKLSWLPALQLHGERFSVVREALLVAIGITGYRIAHTEHHRENEFLLGPIKEVAWLFVGIFVTMVPALELIRAEAASGRLLGVPLTTPVFYLATGAFSSVLDNAPTFIAFLSGLEGKTGMDAAQLGRAEDPATVAALSACAVASVFWGAMTYIGNGPNFMIKAIVEAGRGRDGRPLLTVPGFFAYVLRYAVPILLPVLLLVGAVFYR